MDASVQMLIGLSVPGIVIIVMSAVKLLERLGIQAVVRAAAEAQLPMSADAIRALSGTFAVHPRARDLRRGVMLASIGAALAILGLLSYVGTASTGWDGAVALGVILAGVGAIPGCLGVGYIVLSRRDLEVADD